jgi:hypothetical protein
MNATWGAFVLEPLTKDHHDSHAVPVYSVSLCAQDMAVNQQAPAPAADAKERAPHLLKCKLYVKMVVIPFKLSLTQDERKDGFFSTQLHLTMATSKNEIKEELSNYKEQIINELRGSQMEEQLHLNETRSFMMPYDDRTDLGRAATLTWAGSTVYLVIRITPPELKVFAKPVWAANQQCAIAEFKREHNIEGSTLFALQLTREITWPFLPFCPLTQSEASLTWGERTRYGIPPSTPDDGQCMICWHYVDEHPQTVAKCTVVQIGGWA